MPEWDPERENYEPESDFQRDYVTPRLGHQDRTPGRRRSDHERGVWSIGGEPRAVGPDPGPTLPEAETQPGPGHAGKGPRNYRPADLRLYAEVCERLQRHPEVDASGMDVGVADCEVTLSGTVPDDGMRVLAEAVAVSCQGVRGVHNRLQVGEEP